uniref:TRP C-terminal domain-containing protein n=1 Tax=Amphimedon queenslandica TaxID=400682 RepID=A0A1X7UUK7_AMPQE
MVPKVFLVSLLSLVLVYSAAGLECRIYVSSSDGINNTSCWTGGVQTPCATIDLAIQGTATLQYNCSSGILINLSPGTYTLDTTSLLEQQLLRNNVSIIGMRDGNRYEEVSITCLHVSSSSYNWLRYIVFQCVSLYNCNSFPVTCTEPSFDLATHYKPLLGNEACPNYTLVLDSINTSTIDCYDYYRHDHCQCDYFSFNASIVNTCTGKPLNWKYHLNVCFNDSCHEVRSRPTDKKGHSYYEVQDECFDKYIDDSPTEMLLHIYILNVGHTENITVTTTCKCIHGNCTRPNCDTDNQPYKLPCHSHLDNDLQLIGYCYDETTEECYIHCASKGVPLDNVNTCTKCDKYGYLVFITIEILPITIMVLLIIVFNIQLTNGSINGVVFYSQMMSISYSDYSYYYHNHYNPVLPLSEILYNILNLDFTPFIDHKYSLCISTNTPPLGVISFWYVIGFYPLLLLLIHYVWITLYNKGFKCVVFITRPFHRFMARFWSMTGIEQSFTHSIASIYILCFTQLAATSFQILSFDANSTSSFNGTKFYYDMKQDYFKGVHGAAGFFAVLVLLFLIVLPSLYILLYPFMWFHKLLDCLHWRKQLLISLGDVFTGPYKNGTENTYDYRFMAGLYLLAKIIILSQFINGQMFIVSVPFCMACCSFLIAVIVIIFRPFRRNIHNFNEFLIMFTTMSLGCINGVTSYLISKKVPHIDDIYLIVSDTLKIVLPAVNGLFFVIFIPGYIIYRVYKMIRSCYRYHDGFMANREYYRPLVGIGDDCIADRVENPQDYDEQHVLGGMSDDVLEEDQQPVTIVTAATYGSINDN